MAKPVKLAKGEKFPFGKKAVSKYPWDEWFKDAKVDPILLEQSIPTTDAQGHITGKDEKGNVVDIAPKGKRDFEVHPLAMRGKLQFAGRKRYLTVEISYKDAKGKRLVDSLIFQARDMTADEKREEDELRAAEKEEAKERRAAKKKDASANGTPPAPGTTPATPPAKG